MFVLDGLRHVRGRELHVPRFHLGHLGFIPGLNVNYRYERLTGSEGHELTLTPFQGHRDDLFLLKCVFVEKPGVVQNALAAFATLGLNILSLESATIDRNRKHVLFCILSWNTTNYARGALDEGTKHKFIEVLPLLPILDKRYLLLLQVLLLFCLKDLDHEITPEGAWLPKVHIRLFDDFQKPEENWQPLTYQRPLKDESELPPTRSSAFFDLREVLASPRPGDAVDNVAILFSETETKTLRLIFPGAGREKRFLHIAFTHLNRPGALLAIAILVRQCGFNILTSLLRKYDRECNVWETMLEYVGTQQRIDSNEIPIGIDGVRWFRKWCVSEFNRDKMLSVDVIKDMVAYNVRVCRPSYPRSQFDDDEDFEPVDILEKLDATLRPPRGDTSGRKIKALEIQEQLSALRSEAEGVGQYRWLATLALSELEKRLENKRRNGTVFLSLPAECRLHDYIVKQEFQAELGLDVKSYNDPNSENILDTTLKMIRHADFFFSIWHPDKGRNGDVSPWMPFEYGIARSLGKRHAMMAHRDIRKEVKRRIDPSLSLVEYEDLTFREKLKEVIRHCREDWIGGVDTGYFINVED